MAKQKGWSRTSKEGHSPIELRRVHDWWCCWWAEVWCFAWGHVRWGLLSENKSIFVHSYCRDMSSHWRCDFWTGRVDSKRLQSFEWHLLRGIYAWNRPLNYYAAVWKSPLFAFQSFQESRTQGWASQGRVKRNSRVSLMEDTTKTLWWKESRRWTSGKILCGWSRLYADFTVLKSIDCLDEIKQPPAASVYIWLTLSDGLSNLKLEYANPINHQSKPTHTQVAADYFCTANVSRMETFLASKAVNLLSETLCAEGEMMNGEEPAICL